MAQSTEEILKQSQQQTRPDTPSTSATETGAQPAAPVDTYRAMVDPEAASFETPDAAGMKPNIPLPQAPDKQSAANRQADTYRAMVDPEAASFETPDAAGMKPNLPPAR